MRNVFTYIKLAEHMTRRQCHETQVGRVPSRHDNSPVCWIVFDLINALGQLIDAFAVVVGMHVFVLGTKVAPLKTVDRPEVANLAVSQSSLVEKLARTIPIPDVNVLGRQLVGIGIPLLSNKVVRAVNV